MFVILLCCDGVISLHITMLVDNNDITILLIIIIVSVIIVSIYD